MAYRAQGKILIRENGTRMMVVEQKGRDLFRGRKKTLNEALSENIAGVGVDRQLLNQAIRKHDVKIIIVAVDEIRTVFFAHADQFACNDTSSSKPDYRGRAMRVLPYELAKRKYMGPYLRSKRKRVKTA